MPEYKAVVLVRTGFLDKYPKIRSALWNLKGRVKIDEVRKRIYDARERNLDFDTLATGARDQAWKSARHEVDKLIARHYQDVID